MDTEILRFVEPVYRFCLKRLSSHTDAEDLSQEILLCVLQGVKSADIRNMNGYVWRIAHNRYAKTVEAWKRDATFLCGNEYLFNLPSAPGEEDKTEEYQAIFKALHTLSAMYREILVEYYVRGLDVHAISTRHGISVETVKWRLHAGREKIRERIVAMEKTHEKIKMHIMCNGSFGPNQYLCTQLYKAIAKACYKSPMTIEEISLATGVPTLYLEDALEHMIWGDAIEQTGNKYATNFIITSDEQNKKMRSFLNEAVVGKVTDTILQYIGETEVKVRGIGFFDCDFSFGHLLHIMVPAILYATAERMREISPLLPKQRPPRKDGGNGWFIVSEGIERIDENYSGCNGYNYDSKGGQSGRFVYYWVGNTFSDGLNKTLHDARFFINSIGPGGACLFTDDADAAKAFANGLCENRNGRTYPAMPVFTQKQYDAFSEWSKGCEKLNSMWEGWLDSLFTAYRKFTPKRLNDQIGGNVDSYSFNLSAFVLKELQYRELADLPQKDTAFTKNLLLIRE